MELFDKQLTKEQLNEELFNHHPSIDKTGSVRGMIKCGYWKKDDVIIKYKGYYINLSIWVED